MYVCMYVCIYLIIVHKHQYHQWEIYIYHFIYHWSGLSLISISITINITINITIHIKQVWYNIDANMNDTKFDMTIIIYNIKFDILP